MFNGDFSWPFQQVCYDLKTFPRNNPPVLRPWEIHQPEAAASLDRKGPMALLQRLPDGEEVVVAWNKHGENERKKPAGWLGYIGDYIYYLLPIYRGDYSKPL